MSGTREGALKTAATNKLRHGEDYYSRIGKKGGSRSTPTGGFGCPNVGVDCLTGRERASIAGAKGGAKSKRTEAKRWYEKNRVFIEDMIGDGKSYKEISKELKVGVSKLYYVIKKYGDK